MVKSGPIFFHLTSSLPQSWVKCIASTDVNFKLHKTVVLQNGLKQYMKLNQVIRNKQAIMGNSKYSAVCRREQSSNKNSLSISFQSKICSLTHLQSYAV
jgi:hypothetical protein